MKEEFRGRKVMEEIIKEKTFYTKTKIFVTSKIARLVATISCCH